MEEKEWRPISVYVPTELARQARVLAAQQERSRSRLVTEALKQYIERQTDGGQQQRSGGNEP